VRTRIERKGVNLGPSDTHIGVSGDGILHSNHGTVGGGVVVSRGDKGGGPIEAPTTRPTGETSIEKSRPDIKSTTLKPGVPTIIEGSGILLAIRSIDSIEELIKERGEGRTSSQEDDPHGIAHQPLSNLAGTRMRCLPNAEAREGVVGSVVEGDPSPVPKTGGGGKMKAVDSPSGLLRCLGHIEQGSVRGQEALLPAPPTPIQGLGTGNLALQNELEVAVGSRPHHELQPVHDGPADLVVLEVLPGEDRRGEHGGNLGRGDRRVLGRLLGGRLRRLLRAALVPPIEEPTSHHLCDGPQKMMGRTK